MLRNFNITAVGPKVWNGYIKTFMQRNLDNYVPYYTYNRRLSHFLKYSVLFLSVQKKLIFIDMKCEQKKYLNATVQYIKWPSGQFISEDNLACYLSSCRSDTYIFRLSPSLRLNLTFNLIDTKFGTLEVGNPSAAFTPFIYEGYYSTFNLYPKFNFLKVKLQSKCPMCFHISPNIDGSFIVMDKKFIYNVVFNNVTNLQPDFQYIIKNEYYLYWYHLKVIKLNKILIEARE